MKGLDLIDNVNWHVWATGAAALSLLPRATTLAEILDQQRVIHQLRRAQVLHGRVAAGHHMPHVSQRHHPFDSAHCLGSADIPLTSANR